MLLRNIVQKIFLGCQVSILLPVICLLLAGFTLLVYGAVQTVTTIGIALGVGNVSSKEAKIMIISFIEIIDVFLLATVFYIAALGLYELFIDNRVKVPAWLEIRSIDDLKNKLASVVVVILGVVFLGQAVRWESGREILPFGLSVALVIATLTYFLGEKTKSEQMKKLLSSKGTKNLIYSNYENQVEVANNKDQH
ncbi:YqhA family protein [Scytonema sp. UIC 10036]|uniref:YqhA family protein n=1 Tax=Scytonema sp. UIC 10036 TaxID=2304196 RepID=UPI0012DA346C|nr:YqhA family protein [Scytonema sp. UIC 10036]MUG99377.1 YqhA family protein [Scytonema sp. UIC 10036]